jgi:DNA-binding transcriptional LysR family regulator
MDIYQLKTFVVVAREGSITRASEILHLSQPSVSAHIKVIEDALDLALFERTPRGDSGYQPSVVLRRPRPACAQPLPTSP